jgi:hypothetical protein
MEDERWKMENGKWKLKDGKWKMENIIIYELELSERTEIIPEGAGALPSEECVVTFWRG